MTGIDFSKLPLTSLLAPFIALIRSPFSTGPITSTILISVHAFFTYGLISPSSPSVRPALVDLSDALAHLRFEGSDPAADEVVSYRLLAVIDIMMSSEVGDTLGDVEVCELLELVLTICCQMRRGGADDFSLLPGWRAFFLTARSPDRNTASIGRVDDA